VLAPAALMGVVYFGVEALVTLVLSIGAAVGTEALIQKLLRKKITVSDGSAFMTGLLFAMVISPAIVARNVALYNSLVPQVGAILADVLSRNLYIPVVGSFFAIAIAKHAFGGLGCNIWNPALAGRAFVLAAWAGILVGVWPDVEKLAPAPNNYSPPVTSATVRQEKKSLIARSRAGELDSTRGETDPRAAMSKINDELVNRKVSSQSVRESRTAWYARLLVGYRDGCLGETCALWLIIGGLILVFLKYVDWRVPAAFIGSALFLGWMLPVKVLPDRPPAWFAGDPIFDLLTGGLLIGAFFMATDMVTSPITKKGGVIFGLGCGALTAFIRVYGGYPEGVAYAILLMNTAVPLIDRFTRPRVFGFVAKAKK
jgi:electron transport complex protein RnfD